MDDAEQTSVHEQRRSNVVIADDGRVLNGLRYGQEEENRWPTHTIVRDNMTVGRGPRRRYMYRKIP